MAEIEDLEEEVLSQPKPTLEQRAKAMEERSLLRKKETAVARQALNVNKEIEEKKAKDKSITEMAMGAFEATQEQDDSFYDNLGEVVGTALETGYEQVARSIGDTGEGLSHILDFGTIAFDDSGIMDEMDVGVRIPFTDVRIGYVDIDTYKNMEKLYEERTGKAAESLSNFEIEDRDRPDSAAGQMSAEMLKWMGVFALTRGSMKGAAAGQVAKGAAAGAITDFTAFDPHEDRLSDMLQDWREGDTVFNNALTDYLAADGDDIELEGRLKSALEGMLIGGAIDGALLGIKWLKERKLFDRFRKQKSTSTALKDEPVEVKEEVDLDDTAKTAEADEAAPKTDEAAPKTDEAEVDPAAVKEAEEIVDVESARVSKEVFEDGVASPELMFRKPLSQEDVAALGRALAEGDLGAATEVTAFNMDRINWANIEDPDQIKELYRAFEEAAKPMIDEATGGVQSFEMTKAIADDLGYSTAQATELYKKTREHGGLSAKMFATHQAVLGSAQHLKKLAKIAKDGGTDQDWFNLHRHVELHSGLMAMAKGSQTEIARALGAMRMMKTAMEESWQVFDDIASQIGHKKGRNRRTADILASAKDLRQANDLVGKFAGNRWVAALIEIGINGLLSSPKTHIVNFTSNAAMSVIGPVERMIAAGYRTAAGDKHAIREAGAALYAQMSSVGDALEYALKALWEGKPISDNRQRVEFMSRRAIHSDRDDFLGIGIRAVGEIVRSPGRLLLAGDEFFKTINKRAEMAAQSYRVAAELADVKGIPAKKRAEWIKKEMQRIISDPEHSRRIEAAATDYARFSTFQETGLTETGRNFGTALNSSPIIKFTIAPFYRTPMNLLRQAFVDRTPLALALGHWRQQLKKGGPDAAMVYARMTLGSGVFYTAYQMAEEGLITGKRDEYGNTIYLDGKPDYGMEVGGEWVSFNRLDPLGSMLSMAADFNATVRRVYDPGNEETSNKLLEMSSGITAAFMANALNKTWMKSLDAFMEFSKQVSDSGAGTETRKRAASKYFANEAVKYVPFSSAIRSYNQAQDPIQREAWEFQERIQRSLGFSFKTGPDAELPAQRDALGRAVERPESFWWNPFAPNPESTDPVDVELSKLRFNPTIIQKKIMGTDINTQQYGRLKELIGDFGNGSPTAEDQIRKVISTPMWTNKNVTDEMRIQLVKDVLNSRKEVAISLLFKEDTELRKKIIGDDIKAVEAFSGKNLQKLRDKLNLPNPQ